MMLYTHMLTRVEGWKDALNSNCRLFSRKYLRLNRNSYYRLGVGQWGSGGGGRTLEPVLEWFVTTFRPLQRVPPPLPTAPPPPQTPHSPPSRQLSMKQPSKKFVLLNDSENTVDN